MKLKSELENMANPPIPVGWLDKLNIFKLNILEKEEEWRNKQLLFGY